MEMQTKNITYCSHTAEDVDIIYNIYVYIYYTKYSDMLTNDDWVC